MKLRTLLNGAVFAVTLFSMTGLQATNGYWQVGYGTKAVGMGGVATAYPQDTLVAATNPAGMSFVGCRGDAGLSLFMPFRNYSYTGNDNPQPPLQPFPGDHIVSERRTFAIPQFGLNQCLCDNWTVGISVYGNGGMNTKYPRSNPAFDQDYENQKLGVDYMQGILAPTVTYRFCDCHSVGVSLLLGMQRLKFDGGTNFTQTGQFQASIRPDRVTGNGHNCDFGTGIRVGYLGKVLPCLWVGAAYSTPVWMTKDYNYSGLLAEGHLDIPANLSAGLRYEVTPCINVAFDYQYIMYNNVNAIGNSIDNFIGPQNPTGSFLGEPNGPGFGWRNLSVFKIGADWAINSCYTVRAGYSITSLPYSSNEVDFNIVTPAVTTQHFTIGGTWNINCHSELDIAYFFAPENSQTGESKFQLGTITERMHQHFIGVNYGWKW